MAAQESNTERQELDTRKGSFIEEAGCLGKKVDSGPKERNFHSLCLLRFYRERGYMQGKGQSSIFRNNCLNCVIPSTHQVLLTEGTMNGLQLRHESGQLGWPLQGLAWFQNDEQTSDMLYDSTYMKFKSRQN